MMRRLLVMSGLVMLGGFGVVSSDVRGVFCCLFVVICCFLGHRGFPFPIVGILSPLLATKRDMGSSNVRQRLPKRACIAKELTARGVPMAGAAPLGRRLRCNR